MDPNQPTNPDQPPKPVTQPSLPEAQAIGSEAPVVAGIDSASPSPSPTPTPSSIPEEDAIFVIQPQAKKPVDKKSVVVTIIFTILGIALLLGVLVIALIGSATGLANDYRSLAMSQMNKLDVPLKDLEPTAVLNHRNLDKPLQTISISNQSQPALENVLFIGELSPRYKATESAQVQVHQHYKDINTYADEVKTLITFDDELQSIFDQEPTLIATIAPSNSLTIRSVSGSYEGFASKIDKTAAPTQTKAVKENIVKIYQTQAAIYINWAKSVEAGDAGGATKARQELVANSAKIVPLVEDQYYSKLFQSSYKKLLEAHKNLKSTLAS